MSHHKGQIAVPRDGETPFPVQVNAFAITSLQSHPSYHYNVFPKVHTSNGERDIPERFKWILFELLQDQAQIRPRMLFDGVVNAFGLIEASQQVTTYQVVVEGKSRPYQITLEQVAIIQPDALNRFLKGQELLTSEVLTARMLVNVMLRAHARANRSYSQAPNAFFIDRGQQTPSVGAFELWKGFFQSVKPGQGLLYVNIDSTMASMYMRGSVIDSLRLLLGKRNIRDLYHLSPFEKRTVERFLRSLRVELIYRSPIVTKSISEIEWMSANDYWFDTEGGQTNVAAYFFQLLSRSLQYPDLPLLARFGKHAAIPLELLNIVPGQFYRGLAPEFVKQKMIQMSGGVRPDARFEEVNSAYNLLEYSASDYIRQSGTVIQPGLIQANARLLPHPTLEYANVEDQVASDGFRDDGAWDIMRRRFRCPEVIRAWAIVIVRERGSSIEGLGAGVKELRLCLVNRGLTIETEPYINDNANPDDLKKELSRAVHHAWERYPGRKPKTPAVSFVLVVIPESKELRIAIKQWGDIEKGVVTQIVRASKLNEARNQYCNNLALKINIKLGGVNNTTTQQSLEHILKLGTMVVGIDTSHPHPGVKDLPTVSGFVFSTDVKATRYRAITDVQQPRQEIIADVGQKLKEAITAFQSANGKRPSGILIYRDGVSEGEFAAVEQIELGGMKGKSAVLLEMNHDIPLTFVIVTKRHHVKFLPSQPSNRDRTGNAPTGTLVDTTVVAPNLPNFYLVGQGGLKGTSCPAHYTMLSDENDFGLQRLQQLSYVLCHTQQRATRVISLPAPLYYADLVAARGPFHIDISEHGNDDTEKSIEWFKSMFQPIHPNLQQRMYWIAQWKPEPSFVIYNYETTFVH